MAEYYFLVRGVHLWAVGISVGLFVTRAALMLGATGLHRSLPLRVVPHVVDTVLLTSALMLTTIVHQYPFADHWLTAKVLALVGYIVLGSLALHRARTQGGRLLALAGALVAIAYIVGTALHRHPNPLAWA